MQNIKVGDTVNFEQPAANGNKSGEVENISANRENPLLLIRCRGGIFTIRLATECSLQNETVV